MGQGIIYRLTNKKSGLAYIGQTKRTLKRRLYSHCKQPNLKSAFGRALVKNGLDLFRVEILMYCEILELSYYEKACISIFDTKVPHGYNLTLGGQEGAPPQKVGSKIWDKRRAKYGPNGGNIKGGPGLAALQKAWETRRLRYGDGGNNHKSWETRRQKYGEKGGNLEQLEKPSRELISEKLVAAWERRRGE